MILPLTIFIMTEIPHNFVIGDSIIPTLLSGTNSTGLGMGTDYFVKPYEPDPATADSPYQFTLHPTKTDATGGTNTININDQPNTNNIQFSHEAKDGNAHRQYGYQVKKVVRNSLNYYAISLSSSNDDYIYYETGQTVTIGGTVPPPAGSDSREISNVTSGSSYVVEVFGDEMQTGSNIDNLPRTFRLHTAGTSLAAIDDDSAIDLNMTADDTSAPDGTTVDIDTMTFSVTQSAFSDTGNVDGIPMSFACLLEGTQILTPNGEVSIELLKKGDEILTHDKRVLKIKEIDVSQVGRNKPYKVPKDFFGENLPSADTYLSGDHAIRKIGEDNAWMLPKYLPLEYCLKIENTEKYYNLQLESMEDTFIANGLAVESWDGNQEPTEYYWKKSTERHNFITHHRHYLTEEEIIAVKEGDAEIYKKYIM
jgi:hypothetical protein